MMPMAGRNAVPLFIPARYMVIATISMIAWIALTPWMLPELLVAPLSYPVIAWTHLLTLGCLGSMILGASVQLVPVALQTPFPAEKLAGWAWFLWLAGMVLFEFGFSREILPILAPGATLLGIVLVGYAIAITTMFERSPHRDTVAWHLLAASWFAVLGFVLGWLLALTNVNGVLGGMLLPVLAAHIIVMMVGWVAITILGVGYKLIGMFTLAERQLEQARANISVVLIAIGTMAMAAGITFGCSRLPVSAGAILIAWGITLAALEALRMYQRRMRRLIDVHMPFAIIAWFVMLAGSIALARLTFLENPLAHPLTIAATWLVFSGGFLVAIQGFFYKISTFLIWLNTYAPLAGKMPVPQLDRMYNRSIAFVGLAAWMFSVVAVTAMLLGWLPIWWGWSIGLWMGGILFAINIARIAKHWHAPMARKNNRLKSIS